MILFLDTEFTDLTSEMELLSLAIVGDKGVELYLERNDVPRERCSPFVLNTVLPLMGRIQGAAGDFEWCQALLRVFMRALPGPSNILACDSPFDTMHLKRLWGQSEPWPAHVETTRIHLEQITQPEFENAVHAYHQFPGRPWHHALWDARALRSAWRVIES